MRDVRDRDVLLSVSLITLAAVGFEIPLRLSESTGGTAIAMALIYVYAGMFGAGILALFRRKILGAVLGVTAMTTHLLCVSWQYL